jgi:hypothetical protein
LVQATTLANVSARVAKIRGRPEAFAWLKAGGAVQVWGWVQRGRHWHVKVVELRAKDLAVTVVTTPGRWRRGKHFRQRGLFADGPP